MCSSVTGNFFTNGFSLYVPRFRASLNIAIHRLSDLSLFDNPMKRQNVKLRDSESEAVKSCGKDDKVGLLHAVGRVLYPKCKHWILTVPQTTTNSCIPKHGFL